MIKLIKTVKKFMTVKKIHECTQVKLNRLTEKVLLILFLGLITTFD